MASGTGDSDFGTGDRDQRAFPFLVAECSGTLEGDLWSVNSGRT
jgi:hypothetical protein